jgi:hypothetical protein
MRPRGPPREAAERPRFGYRKAVESERRRRELRAETAKREAAEARKQAFERDRKSHSDALLDHLSSLVASFVSAEFQASEPANPVQNPTSQEPISNDITDYRSVCPRVLS